MATGSAVQDGIVGNVQVTLGDSGPNAAALVNAGNRGRGRGGRGGRGRGSGRGRRSTSGPVPEVDHNIEVRFLSIYLFICLFIRKWPGH